MLLNYIKEIKDGSEYLFVEIQENATPIWHQVEMLSINPGIGFPEPFYTEKDDKCYFLYQINNLINLDKFSASRQVDALDFCEGIAKLCWSIMDSDRYLLYKNSFIYKAECVYVNEDIKNLQLIYFPCKTIENANDSLKIMICELVTSTINFTQGQEFAVATLLQYIKSRDFSIEGLINVCDEILRKRENSEEDEFQYNDNISLCTNQTTNESDVPHIIKSNKFLNFQFIVLGIGICIFIFPIHKIIRFQGIDARSCALFLLVGLDLLYLVFFKLYKSKPAQTSISRHEDKTVFLKHIAVCFGYLLDRQTKEQHELNKKEIVIGRKKEDVDVFCENAAVGKKHARLEFREGGYLVKDLDSKNGTFINGERLESGNEKRIKHGDIVSFANSEFIVFTSKPV